MSRGCGIGFLACALGVVGGACTAEDPDAGPLSEADVAAIADLRSAFVRAELSGERRAQASLFADDGVILEAAGPMVQGRRAIEEALEEFDVVLRDFALTSVEVGGAGTVAYDRGRYSLEFFQFGSGAPMGESGNYFMVLRKRSDGSWRIAALIHNSDEP